MSTPETDIKPDQTQSAPQPDLSLDDSIDRIADHFAVPRDLWRAMVNKESGGRVNVGNSSKGAQGLFQIMPATASAIKKPNGQSINPGDPIEAAYGGLKILSDNYKKFRPLAQNDRHAWGMAIAGYHGNPANVLKDIRNGGTGIPDQDDGTINTQDHVYKILKNAPNIGRGAVAPEPEAPPTSITPDEPPANLTPRQQAQLAMGQQPSVLTATNTAAITRPRRVTSAPELNPQGAALPQQGTMGGALHLNEAIAPKVPAGAPRPFAPGEWVDNPDGSWSSEITQTVAGDATFNGGKPTVIPGMWLVNGKPQRVSEDQATAYAKASGLSFPSFNSIAEAEKYANDRESLWQGVDRHQAAKVPPLWSSPLSQDFSGAINAAQQHLDTDQAAKEAAEGAVDFSGAIDRTQSVLANEAVDAQAVDQFYGEGTYARNKDHPHLAEMVQTAKIQLAVNNASAMNRRSDVERQQREVRRQQIAQRQAQVAQQRRAQARAVMQGQPQRSLLDLPDTLPGMREARQMQNTPTPPPANGTIDYGNAVDVDRTAGFRPRVNRPVSFSLNAPPEGVPVGVDPQEQQMRAAARQIVVSRNGGDDHIAQVRSDYQKVGRDTAIIDKHLADQTEAEYHRQQMAQLSDSDRESIQSTANDFLHTNRLLRAANIGSEALAQVLPNMVGGSLRFLGDVFNSDSIRDTAAEVRKEGNKRVLAAGLAKSSLSTPERAVATVTDWAGNVFQIAALSAVLGPTKAMAAMNSLSTLGATGSYSKAVGAGVKGAAYGKLFEFLPNLEPYPQAQGYVQKMANIGTDVAAVGTGTYTVERASGATHDEALKAAATNATAAGIMRMTEIVPNLKPYITEPLARAAVRMKGLPEWARDPLADIGGFKRAVFVEDIPQGRIGEGPGARALAFYKDPQTGGEGGTEIDSSTADKYAKDGQPVVRVSSTQYEQMLDRIRSVNPEQADQIGGAPPPQPLLPEESAARVRTSPFPRTADEYAAPEIAREERVQAEQALERARTKQIQTLNALPSEGPRTAAEDEYWNKVIPAVHDAEDNLARENQAAMLRALDRANQDGNGDAVKHLIERSRQFGATTEQINEVLTKPSGAVTPPAPETPRVPEQPGSVKAQLQALYDGESSRKAVIIPPGQDVPTNIPSELRTVETTRGVVIYDPSRIGPQTVEQIMEGDRSHELTGMPNGEAPDATVAGVARAGVDGLHVKKGQELWAGYLVPGNEDKFRKEALKQFEQYEPTFEFGGKDVEKSVLDARLSPEKEAPAKNVETAAVTPAAKSVAPATSSQSMGASKETKAVLAKQNSAPAAEKVLRQSLDPRGANINPIAQSVLDTPQWRTRVLTELGDGAQALESTGASADFETANGDIVKIHSAYGRSENPTLGTRHDGIFIERIPGNQQDAHGTERRAGERRQQSRKVESERRSGKARRIQSERERRRAAERAADTDDLTGLANQRAWKRALPAAEADSGVTILTGDINSMKAANDSGGHDVGDALIKRAGEAMRAAAQESGENRVFRSGIGDEVSAIVPKAKAGAIRKRAEELFAPETHAGKSVSLSVGAGATFKEAEANLMPRKEAAKGVAPKLEPAETQGLAESTPSPKDGNKITNKGGMVEFPAEMGSLDLPRAVMPQIDNAHRGAMVNFLKGRGIDWDAEEVAPNTLKPSQSEYEQAKVERSREFAKENADKEPRKILVSSDDYVIDAHHQWMAKYEDEPATPIPILRLHAPANVIITELARFPASTVDGTHHETQESGKNITGSITGPVAEGLTLAEIKRRLPIGFIEDSVQIVDGRIQATEKPDYGGRKMWVSLKKATAKPVEAATAGMAGVSRLAGEAEARRSKEIEHATDLEREVAADTAAKMRRIQRARSQEKKIVKGEEPAQHVILIACSAQKSEAAAPANELYQGDLFKKSRQYAEGQVDDQEADGHYILSAEHGLVEPTKKLKPYDRTLSKMTPTERTAWGERVVDQIVKFIPAGSSITLLAGNDYAEPIEARLKSLHYEIARPLKGLGIGEQKAKLIQMIGTVEEESREFSSTQVQITGKAAKLMRAAQAKIDPSDLNEAEGGIEQDHHVTVKYGVHDADSAGVEQASAGHGPVKAKFGKVGIFAASPDPQVQAKTGVNYDVVYVAIDSPDLRALNKAISEGVEVTDTHPTYKPHATLAYVNAGEGEKYVGMDVGLEGQPLTFDTVVFSSKDRSTKDIPLSKQPVAFDDEDKGRPRRNAIDSYALENALSTKAQAALAEMFKQRKNLGQRYIREAMEVYHRLLEDEQDIDAARAVRDAADAYFLDETPEKAAALQDASWEGLKILTGDENPDPAELLENEVFADAKEAGRLIFDTLDPRTASFDTEEFNTAFGDVEFRRDPDNVFPTPKNQVNKHIEDPPPVKKDDYAPRPQDQTDLQISQEEANARIASWKEFAKRVGEEEDHSKETIISLYDVTGIWSQPYVDAGYNVKRYDIKSGQDLMDFGSWMMDIEEEISEGRRIVGILAQPPCTTYTLSGTRWWKDRHDAENVTEVERIGGLWATEFFKRPIDYANTLVAVCKLVIEQADPEIFYAMENPVGRIDTQNHLPDFTLKFNPYVYGDPYTKQTQIWGDFNPDLPVANVHPSEGQKIHKLRGDVPEQKAERSKTPEGFAYAFFMANNTSNLQMGQESVTALAKQNKLFVQIGSKRHPFGTPEDASRRWAKARDTAGVGASETPEVLIVTEDGTKVGHISYNGKVWEDGNTGDWQDDRLVWGGPEQPSERQFSDETLNGETPREAATREERDAKAVRGNQKQLSGQREATKGSEETGVDDIHREREGRRPVKQSKEPASGQAEAPMGSTPETVEPWQMTTAEYAQLSGKDDAHREAVEKAIARGEKVPSAVLKGYPWLAADEAIRPYVEGLGALSDKELKAEEKRVGNELNKWANDTPGLLPDGTVNPALGGQAGFEISNKFNATGSEIDARKAKGGPGVPSRGSETRPARGATKEREAEDKEIGRPTPSELQRPSLAGLLQRNEPDEEAIDWEQRAFEVYTRMAPAMHERIQHKNAARMAKIISENIVGDDLLAPKNKMSRAVYEEITGRKLPKGEKATATFQPAVPRQAKPAPSAESVSPPLKAVPAAFTATDVKQFLAKWHGLMKSVRTLSPEKLREVYDTGVRFRQQTNAQDVRFLASLEALSKAVAKNKPEIKPTAETPKPERSGTSLEIKAEKLSDLSSVFDDLVSETEVPKSSEDIESSETPIAGQPFDSEAFDKNREDVIKTSRASGAIHLDKVPAYVETMRGKKVHYVHDPKVHGVIRTVDNQGADKLKEAVAQAFEKQPSPWQASEVEESESPTKNVALVAAQDMARARGIAINKRGSTDYWLKRVREHDAGIEKGTVLFSHGTPRAGQPIDDYEGSAPDVDWNATDNYGKWTHESVARHLGVPADEYIYRSMVDLGDLHPSRVEKTDAAHMRKGGEPDQAYLDDAEAMLEEWGSLETHHAGDKFEEWREALPWSWGEGYDDSDVKDLAREMQAREEETSYPEEEFSFKSNGFPPIVVTHKPDGSLVIEDGNHRADIWGQSYDVAPAWVNDERARQAAGEARIAPFATVSGNEVSLGSEKFATKLLSDALRLSGYDLPRDIAGIYERGGSDSLAAVLDHMGTQGREGAHVLARAVREAGWVDNGRVILYSSGVTRLHELFHYGADLASSGNKDLDERHNAEGFARLVARPEWVLMRPRLIARGYKRALPNLIEEGAATLMSGELLGLTPEQAIDWMAEWYRSFVQAGGSIATKYFKELTQNAEQARIRIRSEFPAAESDARSGDGGSHGWLSSIHDRGQTSAGGSNEEAATEISGESAAERRRREPDSQTLAGEESRGGRSDNGGIQRTGIKLADGETAKSGGVETRSDLHLREGVGDEEMPIAPDVHSLRRGLDELVPELQGQGDAREHNVGARTERPPIGRTTDRGVQQPALGDVSLRDNTDRAYQDLGAEDRVPGTRVGGPIPSDERRGKASNNRAIQPEATGGESRTGERAGKNDRRSAGREPDRDAQRAAVSGDSGATGRSTPAAIEGVLGERGNVQASPALPVGTSGAVRQTDTPEFKRWFGKSAVVDENGDPLVVYHATPAKFTEFADQDERRGFYFTADPEHAASYLRSNLGDNILPVYLSIQKPYEAEDSTDIAVLDPFYLAKKGYDGAKGEFLSIDDDEQIFYVAFNPTQIKSATGNRGTFDPNNPNILFQRGKSDAEKETDVPTVRPGVDRSPEKSKGVREEPLAAIYDTPHPATGEKELSINDDEVVMHTAAMRDLFNEALRSASQQPDRPYVGGLDLAHELAYKIVEVLNNKETPDANRLSGAMLDALQSNDRIIVSDPESLPHERQHKQSRNLSQREPLSTRLTPEGFARLHDRPEWGYIKGRLIDLGYDDEDGLLTEEAMTWLSQGHYAELGVTPAQGDRWMQEWFTAFAEKHGDSTLEQFRELTRATQSALTAATNARRTARGSGGDDEALQGMAGGGGRGAKQGDAPGISRSTGEPDDESLANIRARDDEDPLAAIDRLYAELPENELSGIKNAQTDEERRAIGWAPVEIEARRTLRDVFDTARAGFDPEDARAKTETLAKQPRALGAEETAGMIVYKTWLKNQYDKVSKDLIEIERKGGDKTPVRIRLAALDEDLLTYHEMARRTGYEQGLGLRLRAEMMKQDYSIAEVKTRARALNYGVLTPEIEQRLEDLVKERDAAVTRLEEYDAKASQRAMEAELKKRRMAQQRADRMAEQQAQGVVRKHRRVIAKSELKVEFANLSSQWRKAMLKAPSNPFLDPDLYRIIGQMVENLLGQGANSVAEIIDPIYKVAEENGTEGTERELRDAISGYGNVIQISKDEIDVRRRELKSLMRDLTALEVIEKEHARPARTGFQRGKLTQRQRESQKHIQSALRKFGLEIEREDLRSPEEKQQSAQDAMKSRLRNRIEDLKYTIGGGVRGPKFPGPVPDEEARVLMAERDRLQAVLDEITGPSELTDDEKIARATKAVERSIAEHERMIAEDDIEPHPPTVAPWSVELGQLKQQDAGLMKQIKDLRKASAHPTQEQRRLEGELKRIQKRIADLEAQAAGAPAAPKRAVTPKPTNAAVDAARAHRDTLQKILADLKRAAKTPYVPPSANHVWSAAELDAESKRMATKLRAAKTSLAKRDAELAERLRTGNYGPKKRPIPVDNDEIRSMRAEVKRKEEQIEMELKKIDLANEGWMEWFRRHGVGLRRAVGLSSTAVIVKLTVAANARIILSIGDEAAGASLPYLPVVGAVARNAPSEGYLDPHAEYMHIATAYSKAMREQFVKVLKTGKMDIDVLHGKKHEFDMPHVWYEYIGHMHAALKTPAKLAAFERFMAKNLAWLDRHGYDSNDEGMRALAAGRAVIDANRQIFQQDNVVSDLFTRLVRGLEQKKYPNDNDPKKARIQRHPLAAAGLRLMFFVTKVPPNYLWEGVGYTPAGLGIAAWRLYRYISVHGLGDTSAAWSEGGGSSEPPIPPSGGRFNPFDSDDAGRANDADAVIRATKKGLFGSVMLLALTVLSALGYNFIQFGGYYRRGEKKRKPGDIPAGGVRIFGWDLPTAAAHFPQLEALQAVYSAVKVFQEFHGEDKGIAASAAHGLWNAATGMLEHLPFYEESARALEAFREAESGTQYVAGIGRGMLIPPDVQRLARAQDPSEPTTKLQKIGELTGFRHQTPVKRKPTGSIAQVMAQEFELGLPHIADSIPNRQNVSPDEKKVRSDKEAKFREDVENLRDTVGAEKFVKIIGESQSALDSLTPAQKAQWAHTVDEITQSVQASEILPEDPARIVSDLQLTDFQRNFKKKHILDAMMAFRAMPEGNKALVRDILIEKGPAIKKLRIMDQAAAEKEFKDLTAETSATKTRQGSPPWWRRMQEARSKLPATPTPH